MYRKCIHDRSTVTRISEYSTAGNGLEEWSGRRSGKASESGKVNIRHSLKMLLIQFESKSAEISNLDSMIQEAARVALEKARAEKAAAEQKAAAKSSTE